MRLDKKVDSMFFPSCKNAKGWFLFFYFLEIKTVETYTFLSFLYVCTVFLLVSTQDSFYFMFQHV